MTNSVPPKPSRRVSLGFREAIGVFVAFGAIGTILFWSLSQETGFNPTGTTPETFLGPRTTPLPEASTTTEPERIRSESPSVTESPPALDTAPQTTPEPLPDSTPTISPQP